jgi:hypothetical protein
MSSLTSRKTTHAAITATLNISCIRMKCGPIHVGYWLHQHSTSPWQGDADTVVGLAQLQEKPPMQPWQPHLTSHISIWDGGPSTSDTDYVSTAPTFDREMPTWWLVKKKKRKSTVYLSQRSLKVRRSKCLTHVTVLNRHVNFYKGIPEVAEPFQRPLCSPVTDMSVAWLSVSSLF